MRAHVYRNEPLDFHINDIVDLPRARKVLLCTPDHFKIVDVKNVHMEGHVGMADSDQAMKEWQGLKDVYDQLKEEGFLDEVLVIDGQPGLEDMVFTANQSMPWITESGEKEVIMSHMRHMSRRMEVPHFEEFYAKQGYRILKLESDDMYEGMGDTIMHPEKRLLYGGFGHRSTSQVYDEVAEKLNVPVITLRLQDERFYHLDTCFCPLDKETVLLTHEAFSDDALGKIARLFRYVITIPVEEAAHGFALNAHVMADPKTGRKVAILQKGSPVMVYELKRHGFEVFEIETGEFMKSGGSVFCMKMMIY